jgi:hypothetical protein
LNEPSNVQDLVLIIPLIRRPDLLFHNNFLLGLSQPRN